MAGRRISIGGAPLRGPMRVLSVALCGVFLLVAARSWQTPQSFEASSAVQIRTASPTSLPLLEHRLLTRDMLEATARRHGVSGALALAQSVALLPLTTRAGETFGVAPRAIGVIVAVRLEDPEQAVRVANDIALQLLDLADAGQVDPGAETLSLLRAEEDRLWQEASALQSDPGLDAEGRRKLGLLQAEYDAARARLGDAEVAARIAGRLEATPYALLSRARLAVATRPDERTTLAGLAAGALVLALLSALIGREVTLPFRSTRSADSARSRSS